MDKNEICRGESYAGVIAKVIWIIGIIVAFIISPLIVGYFILSSVLPILFVFFIFGLIFQLISKKDFIVYETHVEITAAYKNNKMDIPISNISAISTGILGSIVITSASGKISCTFLKNKSVMYEELNRLFLKNNENKNASVNTTVVAQSEADELKKYKQLLDEGIISQEEFDAKKRIILGID